MTPFPIYLPALDLDHIPGAVFGGCYLDRHGYNLLWEVLMMWHHYLQIRWTASPHF
jgi:hypothetical protein